MDRLLLNVPPLDATSIWALIYSYTYALSILAVGQFLRKICRLPRDLTRKFVHIAAGSWVWAVCILFESKIWGLLPFASFILVNFLLYRWQLLDSISAPDDSPGTVYFAAVITLLFSLLWQPGHSTNMIHLALAGIMAMTWGDAFAAIVGIRIGRRRFNLLPGITNVRSLEGSLTMLSVSFLAIGVTLTALQQPVLPVGLRVPVLQGVATSDVWIAALITAAFAAAVEAISPWGMDNLLVPLSSAALLSILLPPLMGKSAVPTA